MENQGYFLFHHRKQQTRHYLFTEILVRRAFLVSDIASDLGPSSKSFLCRSLDFEKRYDAIKMEKFLILRLNGTHLHPITFTATILTMRPQISYDFTKSVVIDPKNTKCSGLRLMTYGEFYKASKMLFDDDSFTIEVEVRTKEIMESVLDRNCSLCSWKRLKSHCSSTSCRPTTSWTTLRS